MQTIEGGQIKPNPVNGRIVAITTSGETAEFATVSAAKHWLAMDHAIEEGKAWREGMRGH